jgi:hypothetical protein
MEWETISSTYLEVPISSEYICIRNSNGPHSNSMYEGNLILEKIQSELSTVGHRYASSDTARYRQSIRRI